MNAANADQWTIFDYEATMLVEMWNLGVTGARARLPGAVQNATVESMLLHLRILVDILLSRDGTKSDDIKLKELLPSFRSPLLDELRNKYGNSRMVGSRCWALNKMLAHPTKLRSASYSYDAVVNPLMPVVVPLVDEIVKARQTK